MFHRCRLGFGDNYSTSSFERHGETEKCSIVISKQLRPLQILRSWARGDSAYWIGQCSSVDGHVQDSSPTWISKTIIKRSSHRHTLLSRPCTPYTFLLSPLAFPLLPVMCLSENKVAIKCSAVSPKQPRYVDTSKMNFGSFILSKIHTLGTVL